jgi:hypothetical protein
MQPDAYQDDMARFLRLSDEDVQRLFRGLPPGRDEDLRDLADFLADATQALSRPPRNDVEAGHLALIAEAVRPPSEKALAPTPAATRTGTPMARSTERRGPMRLRTVRWAVKVAVATASVVLTTAALAFAGVDLPGTAAETAFQKVLGVDLPNQAEEHAGAVPEELPEGAADTALAVLDVIREWRSGAEWSGCEFGARVSTAARGLEGEPDTSHCAGADGGGSVAAGGSENASHANEGLETADEASGGAASDGASNADDGLGIADEASDGAGSDGASNADDGLGTADGASDGAGSDGASNADDGLGTADGASDGATGGVGGP